MREPPRILFDGNDGTYDQGYWLTLPSSKADLAALEIEPSEGMRIRIYSPGELEMDARLHWDEWLNDWVAIPVPNTINHLDGSDTDGS